VLAARCVSTTRRHFLCAGVTCVGVGVGELTCAADCVAVCVLWDTRITNQGVFEGGLTHTHAVLIAWPCVVWHTCSTGQGGL